VSSLIAPLFHYRNSWVRATGRVRVCFASHWARPRRVISRGLDHLVGAHEAKKACSWWALRAIFAMTTSNLPLRGGLGAAALCAAATQSAYPIHQMLTALNSVFTGHLNNMESAMGRRVRFGLFSRLSDTWSFAIIFGVIVGLAVLTAYLTHLR
jgi:hypothetical protein